MATRFGGPSPAHSFEIKVRWIVGCLFAVIVVLVATLFFVLKSQSPEGEPTIAASPMEPANASSTSTSKVDILVAKQRIEDGTQLQSFHFDTVAWDVEKLPQGAVYSRDMQSIVGKWGKGVINANLPLLRESVSEQQPVNLLNIPPGFRAVTINVDSRSGVEGFAKPNTRVDVLFTYQDKDGRQKIATIVRFVKILSVGGVTSVGPDGKAVTAAGATTVTLLTAERDAKKIELARNLGQLSLSLVGDQEPGKVKDDPEALDISSIVGNGARDESAPEEPSEGSMMARDPSTGRLVRMLLQKGRWVKDPNF